MTTPVWRVSDLDAELVFDRFLDAGDDLDVLQRVLLRVAPRWSSGVRARAGSAPWAPLDLSEPGALARGILSAATTSGRRVERALVDAVGPPDRQPFAGSAELRGATSDLGVVVGLDQQVVRPRGEALDLRNTVIVRVRSPYVEGRPGSRWMRDTLQALCQDLHPAWAAARHPAEHCRKVVTEEPEVAALGRNFGRYLPGVFWLNFFGRPYRDLIGAARLRSVPGRWVASMGDGVFVELDGEPQDWDSPFYAMAEQRVRDHLGPELFFSRSDPDRGGRAPEWGGPRRA